MLEGKLLWKTLISLNGHVLVSISQAIKLKFNYMILFRGFFLSCVIYCENKILVTLDDVLPVLEIDETFPGAVHKDFHWLLKVDVKIELKL